jgi:hypothetical protein
MEKGSRSRVFYLPDFKQVDPSLGHRRYLITQKDVGKLYGSVSRETWREG